MRKMNIEKWEVDLEGTKQNESILSVIQGLIASKNPAELPKGLAQFRLFQKVSIAFDTGERTGILELEEPEYVFIKGLIENDIPSYWGTNPNIAKAVDEFLNMK